MTQNNFTLCLRSQNQTNEFFKLVINSMYYIYETNPFYIQKQEIFLQYAYFVYQTNNKSFPKRKGHLTQDNDSNETLFKPFRQLFRIMVIHIYRVCSFKLLTHNFCFVSHTFLCFQITTIPVFSHHCFKTSALLYRDIIIILCFYDIDCTSSSVSFIVSPLCHIKANL